MKILFILLLISGCASIETRSESRFIKDCKAIGGAVHVENQEIICEFKP